MSKLLKIVEQRRLDVAALKQPGGVSIDELKRKPAFTSQTLNLFEAIVEQLKVSSMSLIVAAEFKRASPSKGDIAIGLDVGTQAMNYAKAGACIVSVLTEPKWFKGSLEDMLAAREALEEQASTTSSTGNTLKQRALILRKDFIFDKYQIFEARAYGADTILLIVAILDETKLQELLTISRELGMEPLVEVSNSVEMETAIRVGAKVIGVNNRDLHTFKVDLNTTMNMVDIARNKGFLGTKLINGKGVILALSGIKTRHDVKMYEDYGGVAGILVGEALMRAEDPCKLIRNLLGRENLKKSVRVKICGIKDPEAALAAAKAGADFIGIIFVKSSKRYATTMEAQAIVKAIRNFREMDNKVDLAFPCNDEAKESKKRNRTSWFHEWSKYLDSVCIGQARPLVVGVFMDQPIEEVNAIARETGIDLIQLHGSEKLFDEAECALPVIRVVHIDENAKQNSTCIKSTDLNEGPAACILLDTSVKGAASGGTGKTFDWNIAKTICNPETKAKLPLIMAGGLNPDNVASAIASAMPWGVDVSSGVEVSNSPGVKDLDKIKKFVANAKTASNTSS